MDFWSLDDQQQQQQQYLVEELYMNDLLDSLAATPAPTTEEEAPAPTPPPPIPMDVKKDEEESGVHFYPIDGSSGGGSSVISQFLDTFDFSIDEQKEEELVNPPPPPPIPPDDKKGGGEEVDVKDESGVYLYPNSGSCSGSSDILVQFLDNFNFSIDEQKAPPPTTEKEAPAPTTPPPPPPSIPTTTTTNDKKAAEKAIFMSNLPHKSLLREAAIKFGLPYLPTESQVKVTVMSNSKKGYSRVDNMNPGSVLTYPGQGHQGQVTVRSK